jgi:uncharacterized RDD family membrane protein YckC
VEYEDRLTITTPEGVEIELLLANIGSRFLATLLDVAIQGGIGFVGAVIAIAALDGGVLTLVLSIGLFLLLFGYDVLFEVTQRGQTPGKRVAGLRVLRATGAPVTFVTSAIRNVLRLIDILPVFYGVAMLFIFFTRRHQRLGDIAAGTIVVRDQRPAPTTPAPLTGERVYGWDTSAISPEELALVRQFLDRRAALDLGARNQLASDLATRLRSKVAGAGGWDKSPEQFLEALAASRD